MSRFPESLEHALYVEVDGLDSEGQHSQWSVFLRYARKP